MSKLVAKFSKRNRFLDFVVRNSRNESYSTKPRLSDNDVEEIKIPVPWGHIAGRYWGRRDAKTFLLLHGWQDNAGSFDTLVPLLPKENGYLAIDLPGHGHSSHYPPGLFYLAPDAICDIRRIQKYFDWRKMSFIGHSLGSMLSYLFSSVYNDEVDIYIGLDSIKWPNVKMERYHSEAGKRIDKFLVYDSYTAENAKNYTEEVLVSKMKEALQTNNENVCKILMRRGATEKGGHLTLNRDPKVRATNPFSFTQREHLKIAERIKCNVLIIKSVDSPYFEPEENFYEVLDVIRKKAKYLRFAKVSGTHHFHLETPDVAASIIQKFLKEVE